MEGEFIQNDACPKCGAFLEMATSIDDSKERPKPGDLSVCIYCGEVLEFGPDMVVSSISEEKWWKLGVDVRANLILAQAFVKSAQFKPNRIVGTS